MNNREIPVDDQQNEQEAAPAEEQQVQSSQAERSEPDAQQLRDQLLRTMADMENMRRRHRQEQQTTIQFANEGLLKEILPIFDDFNRSVEAGGKSRDFDSFYSGVQMITGKLQKALEKLNVRKIETVGAPFDFNLHEAIMRQPSDKPEDTILMEVEPGYIYGDRVIRHAKVIVSAGS
jgi:molecular chaperone GrpE